MRDAYEDYVQEAMVRPEALHPTRTNLNMFTNKASLQDNVTFYQDAAHIKAQNSASALQGLSAISSVRADPLHASQPSDEGS